MTEIIIKNGKVITPFRIIENGGIVVSGQTIKDVFAGNWQNNLYSEKKGDCLIIDAGGRYISPGFIDIHVHGGGQKGVMDGCVESIKTMCKIHSSRGTTSILPTTTSGPWKDIYRAIDAVREASRSNTGARILGVHLEGPYFSIEQKGAQNEEYIYSPIPADYLNLLDYWDKILMMSVAPEIPGSLQLGRELRKRGIVASIAHSNASYREVIEALEDGYSHITHFYSGCSIVHRNNAYREAGVVESGYIFDELTLDIIADGKHLPPSLLKLIYKTKGADKIALISDGTMYSGEEVEGDYKEIEKDGRNYIIEDGVMKLHDRTRFAGSIATSNRLVHNMVNLADVPLLEAVKMATFSPAKILGINNRKGCISRGLDADIVIFDKDIEVKMVMVEGDIKVNVL